MNLALLKILSTIGIIAETVVFTLWPVFSKSFKSNRALLGNANAFAAGVFMAAGFIHILPDATGAWVTAVSQIFGF